MSRRGGKVFGPAGRAQGLCAALFALTGVAGVLACNQSSPSHGAEGTGGGGSGGGNGEGGGGGAVGCAIEASASDGAAWLTPPPVPAALAAPTGAIVTAHFQGIGAQVYTCTASGGTDATGDGGGGGVTTYAWVLKAPDAQLYDAACVPSGVHSQGPTWTSSLDGSAVVGMKLVQADAPSADAIPWLLLGAASHSGTGVFSEVSYIQRLNTVKGQAPATGCDSSSLGTELRIDYAADYYFYQGGPAPADGGSPSDVGAG
jgi:hypothetical protein